MAVGDCDEERFTTSEDERSLSSATRSVLDMSCANSAYGNDAVVDSTQDTDPKKKSKSRINMMNLNTGMTKEVDLTLHPLSNVNQGVGDG
jgi:hypothetical protein